MSTAEQNGDHLRQTCEPLTNLGYGDITLQAHWRLLSSFEAANGIILFGVSTAIPISFIERIYRDDSDNTASR